MPLNEAHFSGFFLSKGSTFMSEYQKPSFNLGEQLAKLESQGLNISDKDRALHYLNNISYFRLKAYMYPFYKPRQAIKQFITDTCFDDVIALYAFDRELRLIILDAIERIEVALRAQLSNTLANNYGPHGYLDSSIFDSRYNHSWLLSKLKESASKRDTEIFLSHYHNKYASPKQPPIWMVVELLTFAEISRLFANLRVSGDKQAIEKHFGFKFPVLRSWFQTLAVLRNICAHQGRVWNREFGVKPEAPRKTTKNWLYIPETIPVGLNNTQQTITPRFRVYYQLAIIQALMKVVSPNSHWSAKLIALINTKPSIFQTHMGFPVGWENDLFWQ